MTASPGSLSLLPDSQPELSGGQGAKEEPRLTHSPSQTYSRRDFYLGTARSSSRGQPCGERWVGPGGSLAARPLLLRCIHPRTTAARVSLSHALQ